MKFEAEVIAYVHLDFDDLKDFVEAVGEDWFGEGDHQVILTTSSIVVELNDFIEGDGHYLSSYKICFEINDWKRYENEILENEK